MLFFKKKKKIQDPLTLIENNLSADFCRSVAKIKKMDQRRNQRLKKFDAQMDKLWDDFMDTVISR